MYQTLQVTSDAPQGTEQNLLRRAIGSHYGQTPELARLVLSNQVLPSHFAYYTSCRALSNKPLCSPLQIQAYALPMGAISRMIRSTSSHTPGTRGCAAPIPLSFFSPSLSHFFQSSLPGHITTIGLETYVDPKYSGGKLNEMTREAVTPFFSFFFCFACCFIRVIL